MKKKEENKERNKTMKKKEENKKKRTTITIQEDVKINEDTVLEKGDKIEVLDEAMDLNLVVAINNYMNNNQNKSSKEIAIDIADAVVDAVSKNPYFGKDRVSILEQISRMVK